MVTTSVTSPPSSSALFHCTTTTKTLQPYLSSSSSLPSSSTLLFRHPNLSCFRHPNLSCFLSLSPSLSKSHSSKKLSSSSSSLSSIHWPTSPIKSGHSSASVSALVDEAVTLSPGHPVDDDGLVYASTSNNMLKNRELYVCNLPRSCGIAELNNLFKPFGTVQSVEVSRNAETGVSRGSGYVVMSSMEEAKAAIAALDGSDVGGREMRVRYSVDMDMERTYFQPLNSKAERSLIFESPYKIYVGNLAWAVKPKELRDHFSQFGTVTSARVLQDRKGGKNRVYAFLSFSSHAESKAAVSLSGTEFFGRIMLVREVSQKNAS